MIISFKYFNFSSIKCKLKLKYLTNREIYFNNHFKDFSRAKNAILDLKKFFKEIQKIGKNEIDYYFSHKKNCAIKKQMKKLSLH